MMQYNLWTFKRNWRASLFGLNAAAAASAGAAANAAAEANASNTYTPHNLGV